MAMTMNGEVQLAAPREVVWGKLNDPEVLKACIPGCEELEKTDDNGFRAVAKMKVGPVSARFKGRVTLSDLPKAMDVLTPAGVDQATELDRSLGPVVLRGVPVP